MGYTNIHYASLNKQNHDRNIQCKICTWFIILSNAFNLICVGLDKMSNNLNMYVFVGLCVLALHAFPISGLWNG